MIRCERWKESVFLDVWEKNPCFRGCSSGREAQLVVLSRKPMRAGKVADDGLRWGCATAKLCGQLIGLPL